MKASPVQCGSVGSAVKAVQGQAIFRGGRGEGPPVLSVDGTFGAKTRSCMMGFQGVAAQDFQGVAVDAIVGPVTWQLDLGLHLGLRWPRCVPRAQPRWTRQG